MLTVSGGHVFIDSDFAASEKLYNFFKYCVKNDSVLFSNKLELDPIDVISYVMDNPCEAFITNTEANLILDKNNVFEYIGPNSSRFRSLCLLAHDLRERGWHLRRGINYGADFLLYSSSPDKVHSKYAVYLIDSSIEERWSHILGMNRVCVNAKKLMLIAVFDPLSELKFKYVELKRWIPEINRE